MCQIKIKRIVIVLISALVFSAFFSTVLGIFQRYDKQTQIDIQAANMNIGSLADLQSFISRVNNSDETDLNATLTADIDCQSTTLTPIAYGDYGYTGTFDGDGFKIYNFKVTQIKDHLGFGVMGLFGYVEGGTIRNLRISNASYQFTSSYNQRYIGAIYGYAEANSTITNCQVDSITFSASSSVNISNVGGIGGYGGKVSQCYIYDVDITENLNLRSNATGMVVMSGVINDAKSVDQCVFNPNGSVWKVNFCDLSGNSSTVSVYNSGNVYSGSGTAHADRIIPNDISADYINCYYTYTRHLFRGLSYKSGDGGKNVVNGYGDFCPWYHNTSYYEWPQLRYFMGWTDYTIVSSNASAATVNKSSVTLPSDYSVQFSDASSTSTYVLSSYIYVTITGENYVFDGWTVSGTTITANVRDSNAIITFKTVYNASYGDSVYEFQIKPNTSITATISDNKKTVTFTFTIDAGTKSVVYTASDGYYVSETGLTKTSLAGGEKLEITPTIEQKEYNTSFT